MDWKFFLRRKQGGEQRLLNNCPIKRQSPCHSHKLDSALPPGIDPPRLATSTANRERLRPPISSIPSPEFRKSPPLSASEQGAVHARTTTITKFPKTSIKSAS